MFASPGFTVLFCLRFTTVPGTTLNDGSVPWKLITEKFIAFELLKTRFQRWQSRRLKLTRNCNKIVHTFNATQTFRAVSSESELLLSYNSEAQ